MAVDVVALLRELDFSIAEGSTDRSWMLRSPQGETFLVEPTPASDRITAHVVRNAAVHHALGERPLLAGRSITPSMLGLAKSGALDVVTEEPVQMVLRGRLYMAGVPGKAKPAPPTAKRAAWIRWAVERCLLLAGEPLRQGEIAELLGSSQQSVSNASRQLGSLVRDTGAGVVAADWSALLGKWIEDYSGPGGQEFGWYCLDPVVEQTLKAVEIAQLLDSGPLVSGDVAADRLAPWKLPSRGRIYVNSPVDLGGDGFVPAPLAEATLVTCVPQDPTVWRLAGIGPVSTQAEAPLADAALVYWDVMASGDIDSVEAAGHLEQVITESRP